MLQQLLEFLAPFTSIARDLKRIADLYELELGAREHPVYLVTETPRKNDTEVTYSGDEEIKPKFKGWFNE